MELVVIFLLLMVNGVLAMSEIALVSAQNPRLKQRADEGSRGAAAALLLTRTPTRFLSTVQIGISLVGILLGAVGEASIAHDVEQWFARVPFLAPVARVLSVGTVVLAIGFLSVVVGELVPKRLAMSNPELIASWIGWPMLWLSRLFTPVVALLSKTTDFILLFFGIKDNRIDPVTSHEINLLLEEGARAGEFLPEEQRLIETVLHLGDLQISALLVHRTEMIWLDVSTPLEKARHTLRSSAQSYVALCDGGVDRIVGVIGARDLLAPPAPETTLNSLAHRPLFVPESAPVLRVLELLKAAPAPVAFVVDEYGALQGQVSITDVVNHLIGRTRPPSEQQRRPPTPEAGARHDGPESRDER
jgi:putative hemolysin